MPTTVTMPQLGETVTEGTILRWAKKVGDSIVEDEVLVEISTDKVDTEVPSPASGTVLEILVAEGDTVGVGTPLVVIGEAGEAGSSATAPEPAAEPAVEAPSTAEPEPEPEAAPATSPAPAPASAAEPAPASTLAPAPVPEPVPAPISSPRSDSDVEGGGVEDAGGGGSSATRKPTAEEVDAFFAEPDETERQPHLLSPVVRKLIRENEIDVSLLSGSGQGGRITRKDVESYLASAGEVAAPEPAPVAEPEPVAATPPTQPVSPEPEPATTPAPVAASEDSEEVDLDRIRVRTAENLIRAKQTAAHVWTSVEVDYERVERVRQAHKEQFKKDEGFSLTYLPFISRATIDALKAFPIVNSSFYLEQKKSVLHKKVDLGIAIDLNQGGLVVARVRNADGLRLVGIARSIRELADQGREGKLGVDDLTGSTFTITNPGPFGSFMSAPIINLPNVAILSTETVTKRPAVITAADGQDMIAIRHIGYLGLSWDHRAFDGSTAVLFLQRIKQNLETWDWEQELA